MIVIELCGIRLVECDFFLRLLLIDAEIVWLHCDEAQQVGCL